MRSLYEHRSPLRLCPYGLRTVNTPHPVAKYKQTHENNVQDEKNLNVLSDHLSYLKYISKINLKDCYLLIINNNFSDINLKDCYLLIINNNNFCLIKAN